MSKQHNYFVYILTNYQKTVLYVGVTNNLEVRIAQHVEGNSINSFTHKYKCYYLIHYERFQYINDAIDREKEIKSWSRVKKNALIETENKDWKFLNDEIKEEN
jgi:putative endonuclease